MNINYIYVNDIYQYNIILDIYLVRTAGGAIDPTARGLARNDLVGDAGQRRRVLPVPHHGGQAARHPGQTFERKGSGSPRASQVDVPAVRPYQQQRKTRWRRRG